MQHKTIRLAVAAAALLVPAGAAQASFVSLEPTSTYRIPPRSSVNYFAESGETNTVTVTNGSGGALVIADPGATIDSFSDECVISTDKHTATCTPKETLAPTLYVDLDDGNDTFTDSANIPGESDYTDQFCDFEDGDCGQVFTYDTLRSVEVYPGSGNDTLTGNDNPEAFYGNETGTTQAPNGNDVYKGNGGDDTIVDLAQSNVAPKDRVAGAGDDQLFGGPGDDFLSGGAGKDAVNGDDGDDALVGGLDTDTIQGGNGTDSVDYSDQGFYRFAADGTRTVAKPSDVGVTVVLNAAAATTGNGLAGENDTIAGVEDVFGTIATDTITGSDASNALYGDDGPDKMLGNAGNDLLSGGGGADTINAQDALIDLVDCGGGLDVDSLNVDNVDTLRDCSKAKVTTTVVPPVQPVVVRDPADTTKAKITKLKLTKLKLKKVRKNGKVPVTITSDEAAKGSFELEAKAGKKAVVSAVVVLSTKNKTLEAGKATKVTLKVPKKLRKRITKRSKLKVAIRLTDGGGNVTNRTKKVGLKGKAAKKGKGKKGKGKRGK